MLEALNTLGSCIAALAACVATYFAASTLKQSNLAKRSEFVAARPMFTFSGFSFERQKVTKALSSEPEILDPRAGIITGYVRNSGARPASSFTGFIFVLPINSRNEVKAFPIGVADDALPGTEWNIASGRLQVMPDNFPGANLAVHNDPGFFVVVAIAYEDVLASISHRQASFMRWPGVNNNVVSGLLVSATPEERREVLKHHAKLLQPFAEPPPNQRFKPTGHKKPWPAA